MKCGDETMTILAGRGWVGEEVMIEGNFRHLYVSPPRVGARHEVFREARCP